MPFRTISEDAESYRVQGDDGQTLTIAKSGITPQTAGLVGPAPSPVQSQGRAESDAASRLFSGIKSGVSQALDFGGNLDRYGQTVKAAMAGDSEAKQAMAEQSLGTAMGTLKMTPKAREARAGKMGFDTSKTYYHGTKADIEGFDPNALGASTNAGSARQGYFFATDPSTASDYAELSKGGATLRAKTRESEAWKPVEELREKLAGKYGEKWKTPDEYIQLLMGHEPSELSNAGVTKANPNDPLLRKYLDAKESAIKETEILDTDPKRKLDDLNYQKQTLGDKPIGWTNAHLSDAKKNVDYWTNYLHSLNKPIDKLTPVEQVSRKFGKSPEEVQGLIEKWQDRVDNWDQYKKAAFKQHKADLESVNEGISRYTDLVRQETSGQNVLPVHLKTENPYIHDFKGQGYRDTPYSEIMKKAKAEGHDSVIFKNTYDPANPENRVKQDIVAVFEPNQIRSKFAEFDPKKKGSGNISAGLAGAGILGGSAALAGSQTAQAGERNMPLDQASAEALRSQGHISDETFNQMMGQNSSAMPAQSPAAPDFSGGASSSTPPEGVDPNLAASYDQARASVLYGQGSGGPISPGTPRIPAEAERAPAMNLVMPPKAGQGQQPQPFEAGLGEIGKAYGQMSEGAQMGANALANKGNQEARAFRDTGNSLRLQQISEQDKEADRQQHVAEATQKYQQLSDDFQKQAAIDPNRFWKNLDTGAKITAGISIGLGAIGAALTGQSENAALGIVKNAIDRDLQAQKMDIEKKHMGVQAQGNLLSQMRAQFGDERAAYAAARATSLDLARLKIEQISAQSASPIAQANGKKMMGEIELEKQKTLLPFQQQIYQMKAVSQLQGGGGGTGGVNLESPLLKDVRGRYVPGLGLAPSEKEAEHVRTELKPAMDGFKSAIDDMIRFRSENGTALGGLDRKTVAEGKAKAAHLQDLYRQANELGVFKESEAHFVQNMIPSDPTQWGYVLPQLEALKRQVLQSEHNKYQALGLRPMIQETPRR